MTSDREIRRYVEPHPDATVSEVLGRFLLDPRQHEQRVARIVETGRSRPAGAADGPAGGVEGGEA